MTRPEHDELARPAAHGCAALPGAPPPVPVGVAAARNSASEPGAARSGDAGRHPQSTRAGPTAPAVRKALWLNLLIPGGGLVLVGAWASGLLGALLFIVSANLAVVSTLLFPDDFGPAARGLTIGVAAASYVGAQLRMAQAAARLAAASRAAARRRTLGDAEYFMEQREFVAAVELLQPLAQEHPRDLLVCYRLAQALSAAPDPVGAHAAWQRLAALDRHGIYPEARHPELRPR